jgi:hypothetical protein
MQYTQDSHGDGCCGGQVVEEFVVLAHLLATNSEADKLSLKRMVDVLWSRPQSNVLWKDNTPDNLGCKRDTTTLLAVNHSVPP